MGSSCVQAALAIIFKYVYKKYHGKKIFLNNIWRIAKKIFLEYLFQTNIPKRINSREAFNQNQ